MKKLVIILTCLLPCFLMAEVKLPHIFSNDMLIQRDQKVNVWGWADKNERVEVVFDKQSKRTKADASGKWSIQLDPVKYGGPHTLTVKGKNNTIILTNILVGDVWLCSGQSNMEWTVANVNNATKEIANANYPSIRSFNVEKNMSMKPLDDLNGKWTVCSPSTVPNYSAVAYFFARKLYEETGIPIGIINSSWGGTGVETWTSADAYKTLGDSFKQQYKNIEIGDDFNTFVGQNDKNKEAYLTALKDDPGLKEQWFGAYTNLSSWKSLEVPGLWSNTELNAVNGIVWFTYEFDLHAEAANKKGALHLGMVDDEDITWINGTKIGETRNYSTKRIYDIPENILKEGKNRITVRVYDTGGDGGIYGNKEELNIVVQGKHYPLAGQWKYKEAVTNAQFNIKDISPNMYHSLLYNAMINPIITFSIKGAIWYQGENNAGAAYDYRTLFPLMINDWRSKWGSEFPFYWVQLANFMAKDDQPVNSGWAELREAQTMTLLLPRTGQAVIIDIGDADDIHPRNKQDVGLRLAYNALNKDYGLKDVVYSGPTFQSMDIQGDKAVITFDNAPEGLRVHNRYGYVEGFAIAGSDKKFYWAKAYADGNKIIVQSDKVKSPVAVRYGWSNNPDINLYNKAGLPATPFRTDDWR